MDKSLPFEKVQPQ